MTSKIEKGSFAILPTFYPIKINLQTGEFIPALFPIEGVDSSSRARPWIRAASRAKPSGPDEPYFQYWLCLFKVFC
jgi:hypothetical protein